ncbi:MAG: fused MFS/spermidine synthase [Pirellulales bacterium]
MDAHLSLLVHNWVYTYTMTLFVVLFGIVLGSLLAARLLHATANRPLVFGSLQMLTGLWILSVMLLPPRVWHSFGENELGACFLLLLPAAIFSGASFPLAVRMVVDDPAFIGRSVGRMTAINTLGGIVGSLAVGFFTLPRLGLQLSLLGLTGFSVTAGAVAWIVLSPQSERIRYLGASLAGVVVWLAIYTLAPTRIPDDFLARRQELVDIREGVMSNVAVLRRREMLEMEIDRMWQGGEEKHHQVMAAHLPMLLHPDPRNVLVVGVGAGQTPSRFLLYDVDRLDCVDIEPAVFEMIRKHFDSKWMDDPRVRLLHEDGRNVLAHSGQQYDVISLEVGQVHRPGVTAFYTADFYRRARRRLRPQGVLSQFLPIAYFTPEEFQSVVATFLDAFPQSYLWYNTGELLLVGVAGDGLDVDVPRMRRLLSEGAIHDDLNFSYWGGEKERLNRMPVFLANFLCDPEGLAELAGDAPLDRDDVPRLEYSMSRVEVTPGGEEPIVELLNAHLASVESIMPISLTKQERLGVDHLRDNNLGDTIVEGYMRGIVALLATGNRAAVVERMTRSLAANPRCVRANRVMALALLEMKRPAESRRYFENALDVAPDDLMSRRGLAQAAFQLGRYDEAVDHYRVVLKTQPDDADVHNKLGEALAQKGETVEALEHFRRALKLRPDFQAAGQNILRLESGRRGRWLN